jgi:hypothetical protein
MNAMPAYVGWLDTAGIKWAGGFLGNASLGLPYISSLILLIDPQTGQFRAILDGAPITSLRTGAQTALPLRRLFGGPAIRLGLFGAGAQGRTQTRAVAEAFDFEPLDGVRHPPGGRRTVRSRDAVRGQGANRHRRFPSAGGQRGRRRDLRHAIQGQVGQAGVVEAGSGPVPMAPIKNAKTRSSCGRTRSAWTMSANACTAARCGSRTKPERSTRRTSMRRSARW